MHGFHEAALGSGLTLDCVSSTVSGFPNQNQPFKLSNTKIRAIAVKTIDTKDVTLDQDSHKISI